MKSPKTLPTNGLEEDIKIKTELTDEIIVSKNTATPEVTRRVSSRRKKPNWLVTFDPSDVPPSSVKVQFQKSPEKEKLNGHGSIKLEKSPSPVIKDKSIQKKSKLVKSIKIRAVPMNNGKFCKLVLQRDSIKTVRIKTKPIQELEKIEIPEEAFIPCCCDKVELTSVNKEEDFEGFCDAIDLIDGERVGCPRKLNILPHPEDSSFVVLCITRSSVQSIFRKLCFYHSQRLEAHHCCPICDIFCTQGEEIIVCADEEDTLHFFHKSCALHRADELICPHCGNKNEMKEITLKIDSDKSPVFLNQRSSRELFIADISKGREQNVPISLINKIDNEDIPFEFNYVTSFILSSTIKSSNKLASIGFCFLNAETLHKCNCNSSSELNCTSDTCSCIMSNSLQYDEFGILQFECEQQQVPIIYECNQLCGCNVNCCSNRVVQKGLTIPLEVFRTFNMSWGVRTKLDIVKGSFIVEYIGEVLTSEEAAKRDDQSCILYMKDFSTCTIDSKYYGNVARFIRHSCNPNLILLSVFIDYEGMPKLALFAKNDIYENEEITMNFGNDICDSRPCVNCNNM